MKDWHAEYVFDVKKQNTAEKHTHTGQHGVGVYHV